MEVDIIIDKMTDCLVETCSGRIVKTCYIKRKVPIQKNDYRGWKFDWSITEKQGYNIYELLIEGDSAIQGRISFRIDGGVADVDIVETAPHNFGRNGQYQGVGAHLFAIACLESMKAGCDGYVVFTSKSNLINYYQYTLGAKVLSGQRMYIDEDAAVVLINKYMKGLM